MSASTIKWWMNQPKEALEVFLHPRPVELETALLKFAYWCGSSETPIWGNGSDFDNAILANAYRASDRIVPWNYTMNRCFRTFRALYPNVHVKESYVRHIAVDDAKYVANYMISAAKQYQIGGDAG